MNHAQNRQRSRSGAAPAAQRPSKQRARARGELTGAAPRVTYDSSWVRSSLSQLDYLYSARAVDVDLRPVIDFAIRWAPFGGAGAGELLVSFGVGRRRFVEMVHAGLRPRRTDNQEARWLERGLLDALASAWKVDDSVAARSVR
ncbi:hypothetical protein [Nocardia sp. MDA0666]|uniref:hypothetical protein n=1 Tax=Nocardia sp. MDA0666 TaxID=2135448 RepID=UPI0011B26A8C|nr:hypothetical protein [Nocardia sp. MDA0666]